MVRMNPKDIIILLLGVIVLISLYAMIFQVQQDMIACDNRIIYERSTLCGMPVYDVNSGKLIIPNRGVTNLTTNISK